MSGDHTDQRIARVRARLKDDPAILAHLAVLAEQEVESLTAALKDAERERDARRERKILCEQLERENERLRRALGAYRSALSSGEPESEQMKELAREALQEPAPQAGPVLECSECGNRDHYPGYEAGDKAPCTGCEKTTVHVVPLNLAHPYSKPAPQGAGEGRTPDGP